MKITYIEEVIGASELLEHLYRHHKQSTIEDFSFRLEAVNPASGDLGFEFECALHINELR